eukprot:CAMPEP_0197515842 /NCGR_PEP_ID=MMETSP1318-20131121/836_1 /TAXON_ID=552666 /ORGANISM="Partenskyella glossopodia, Strain RCC365" /LENGTH=280 /DNA_ID=CAMNT_0043064311 /DNA_START=22 /DNA_END=864 /DNA_ORIENTATION=+
MMQSFCRLRLGVRCVGLSGGKSARSRCSFKRMMSVSVFQQQTYKDFANDNITAQLMTEDSHSILDFSQGGTLGKELNLKAKHVVLPSSGEEETTDSVIVDDFFALSQRGQEPWIDRVFLEDPAYDIELKNITDFFYGIYNQMKRQGRLVILTRPHDCSHYPLFPLAVDKWNEAHPPVTFYSDRLQRAGFQVRMKSASTTIQTETESWMEEIESGRIRAFQSIEKKEMQNGLEELDDLVEGMEHIQFEDKLVLITAVKLEEGQETESLIVQDEGPPYGHCG